MPFYRAWYTSRVDADAAATAALANIVAAYAAASGLDPVIAAGEAPQLAAPTVKLEVLTVEDMPAGSFPAWPVDAPLSQKRPVYRVGYEMTEVVSGEKGRIWNNVPATWAPAALDRSLGPTTPGTPSTVAASIGTVASYGTSPPAVTLSGTPVAGVSIVRIEIQGRDPSSGVPIFRWSIDGGATWGASGVSVAATVALGASGVSANFPTATYALGPVIASGTTPPAVTVSGTPVATVTGLVIVITTGGALGTAKFKYSTDGGASWAATGITTAASVSLGSTGLTAGFASATYHDGTVTGETADTYTATTTASYTTGDTWTSSAIPGYTTPDVTLTGTPADVTVLGVLQSIPSVKLRIDTTGDLGVAKFSYSIDGGSTWTTGLTTGASVVLGTADNPTGVTASFPAGTYGAGVTYTADVIASHWAAPNVGDVAYHTVGDALEWRTRVVPTADGRYRVDMFTVPEGT